MDHKKMCKAHNHKKIQWVFFNQFKPSAAFHIETSQLFCFAKQVTGFYMKSNNGLKWININDF